MNTNKNSIFQNGKQQQQEDSEKEIHALTDGAAVQDYITNLFSKISDMSDDSGSDITTNSNLFRRESILRQGHEDDLISSHSLVDSSVDDLHDAAALANALKGGSQGGIQTQVVSCSCHSTFNYFKNWDELSLLKIMRY